MKLKVIGSGSTGNCYLLVADSGETLILDAGVPIKEIKKGLNWNIRDVVGCVVTHEHKDHSRSIEDLRNIGIRVIAPYESGEVLKMRFKLGEFEVQAFGLTTLDEKWTHTNADGTECPCHGFLVTHKGMGRLLYITDTELIKWKFKKINHILIGVNYDKNLVCMGSPKTNHVLRGHMSIDTACEFVKTNLSDHLQNVIMCHLSEENSDPVIFIRKMKSSIQGVNVSIAEKNKILDLAAKDKCPF